MDRFYFLDALRSLLSFHSLNSSAKFTHSQNFLDVLDLSRNGLPTLNHALNDEVTDLADNSGGYKACISCGSFLSHLHISRQATLKSRGDLHFFLYSKNSPSKFFGLFYSVRGLTSETRGQLEGSHLGRKQQKGACCECDQCSENSRESSSTRWVTCKCRRAPPTAFRGRM